MKPEEMVFSVKLRREEMDWFSVTFLPPGKSVGAREVRVAYIKMWDDAQSYMVLGGVHDPCTSWCDRAAFIEDGKLTRGAPFIKWASRMSGWPINRLRYSMERAVERPPAQRADLSFAEWLNYIKLHPPYVMHWEDGWSLM